MVSPTPSTSTSGSLVHRAHAAPSRCSVRILPLHFGSLSAERPGAESQMMRARSKGGPEGWSKCSPGRIAVRNGGTRHANEFTKPRATDTPPGKARRTR